MTAPIGKGTRSLLAKTKASNRGTRSLLSLARCGLHGADDRLALKAMALSRALDSVLAEIGRPSRQVGWEVVRAEAGGAPALKRRVAA